MTVPWDDASLVQASLAGNRAAFSELESRYRNAVFGIAFHRLGDCELALDVTQDVLVTAYAELSRLNEPAKFSHWLYQITRHKTAGIFRHARPVVSLDNQDGHSQLADAISQDAVEQSEHAWQVKEALRSLPERDRLLIILHYACGYSHREIGVMLEMTISAIKSRIHRARSLLQEELLEMVERYVQAELPNIDLERGIAARDHVSHGIPRRNLAVIPTYQFGAEVQYTPAAIGAFCSIIAELSGRGDVHAIAVPNVYSNSPEYKMLTALGFHEQEKLSTHIYAGMLPPEPISVPPIPEGITIRRASTLTPLELATGSVAIMAKNVNEESAIWDEMIRSQCLALKKSAAKHNGINREPATCTWWYMPAIISLPSSEPLHILQPMLPFTDGRQALIFSSGASIYPLIRQDISSPGEQDAR